MYLKKFNFYCIKYILIVLLITMSNFIQAQIITNKDKIEFYNFNHESEKTNALQLVDFSLKKHGYFQGYGDLRNGIAEIIKENRIKIWNENNYYFHISIFPDSQTGHDFSMNISKQDTTITDLVVGEVLPPPQKRKNKHK